MISNIRTLTHIRTPRMLKGFRACINTTGQSQILAEWGRVFSEECRRLNRVRNVKSQSTLFRRVM